jgi:hypothetical protein
MHRWTIMMTITALQRDKEVAAALSALEASEALADAGAPAHVSR